MDKTTVISGKALIGEKFEMSPVDIFIADGIITAIEENPRAPDIWICPALFNAHTHLGDTIAMDCGVTGDLTTLVTPPEGLKHRLLAQASYPELVEGMRKSIDGMISRGTYGCADFREGGQTGVAGLLEAVANLPFRTFIFGRDGGESSGDGIGISSVRDIRDADRQVETARNCGKKVAFHAGERDPDDVDEALAYDPDLIIHATHATKRQLRECADRNIPIAVCPRSNWVLGVAKSSAHPPIRIMLDLGCTVYLGTDNVMFVPPDLLSEMAFTSIIYGIEPEVILHSAVAGSAISGISCFIHAGARANLFTLDAAHSAIRFSRDPVATIVRRACGLPIGKNVFNW